MFALLSALMSFVYLASFPAVVIFLFFNWKIAIGLIPVGIAAAFLAKWLNGRKLRQLYGREAGRLLNEVDWASERRLNF